MPASIVVLSAIDSDVSEGDRGYARNRKATSSAVESDGLASGCGSL